MFGCVFAGGAGANQRQSEGEGAGDHRTAVERAARQRPQALQVGVVTHF